MKCDVRVVTVKREKSCYVDGQSTKVHEGRRPRRREGVRTGGRRERKGEESMSTIEMRKDFCLPQPAGARFMNTVFRFVARMLSRWLASARGTRRPP